MQGNSNCFKSTQRCFKMLLIKEAQFHESIAFNFAHTTCVCLNIFLSLQIKRTLQLNNEVMKRLYNAKYTLIIHFL